VGRRHPGVQLIPLPKPDPGWLAEARAEAVRVMTDAVIERLGRLRYVPIGLVGRPLIEDVVRAQIDALSSLPAPTRRALLEEP
jgi:hypothetical protein